MKQVLLFLAFCAVVLSSCAKKEVKELEKFSTPEKTYRLWLETAEKGDVQNNMKCVTEASKRIMEQQLTQMDAFIGRLNANVMVFKTYTITDQKMLEDKAVVMLKDKKGSLMIVPLMKESEGWKIDLVSLFGGMG